VVVKINVVSYLISFSLDRVRNVLHLPEFFAAVGLRMVIIYFDNGSKEFH